jgi:hypothetical protein
MKVQEQNWVVFRAYDHGNRSMLAKNLTRRAAEELVERLSAKGHKQMYEAAQMTEISESIP